MEVGGKYSGRFQAATVSVKHVAVRISRNQQNVASGKVNGMRCGLGACV